MANTDRAIAKQLTAAGWKLKRTSGKHEIWACPCGKHPLVTKATSVGRGRGSQNLRSFIKSEARFGSCAVDLKLG